jgi:cytochrome c oxidase subunit II
VLFAADTQAAYDDVESVFLPVGVAVFVLVAGTLLVLAWRGRRRTQPSRRANHVPLEVMWIVLLVATAAVLIGISFRADDRVRAAGSDRGERIRVVAAKWRWRFEYPAYGIVVRSAEGEVPTLVVPVGADVEFEGVSLDVVHAFWIPEVRFQRQLFPERPTRFAITFPEPGLLSSGRCSFYCGLHHQDMRFSVEVLEPAEFRTWVREMS